MANRNFVVTTESTSDLSREQAERLGVEVIQMSYYLDGVNYDGATALLPEPEFYAKMREKSMPTTSMVSPDQAYQFLEPFVKAGNDVLHIAFSSALSGTFNSFALAAKRLTETYPERKVFVVDSKAASLGEGLLVWHVCRKCDTGASIEETRDFAESIKQNVCHYFTVDDLNHLHRGGRVSKATAILGTILKIKPALHVDEEGRLINIGKIRGRKASLLWLVEKMKEKLTDLENPVVFISHGDCIVDAEFVRDQIKQLLGLQNFEMNYIGPVVGTHSGPNTVALFFLGSNRTEAAK